MIENEEVEVLKEIQKNTEMAMKAIDTILPMVYEDSLSMQLSKQELQFEKIHNRAVNKILEQHEVPRPKNAVQDMMLVSGIHMNTMFDTSASHIADLLIRGNSRGITSMCKEMNHVKAENSATELARELMDFEEMTIKTLKKYL